MPVPKILWVDDEIESLQSQKIFLQNKGYSVHTLTNGFDAIDYIKENIVDVVLIDESMPGITGLETLAKIKEINGQIPVVLITKNETENLMDEAIGSPEMQEVLQSQKSEANTEFFKFISRNYASWINPKTKQVPVLSHTLLK